MRFPAWVDGPKKSKAQRATARLKYIFNLLAGEHCDRMSVRALSDKVGLDHSTMSWYIRRGSCSPSGAYTIIKALKTTLVTQDGLIDPLSIK